MRRSFSIFLSIVLCIVLCPVHVYASEEYTVSKVLEDGSYESLYTASSYSTALAYYDSLEEHGNYTIFKGDTIVKVRYGIVSFAENKGCNYTVSYTNAYNNQSGYTNGCYGADGLYLDTNNTLSRVKFQLSNAIGWAKISDVTIYPYEVFSTFTSYFVDDSHLYHQIKTSVHSDTFATTVDLGVAPSYLQANKIYYSYDGKYFYEDFYTMRDDVYSSIHTHAVNPTTPYYNYYQYLSNRTLTQYTEEEINAYVSDILGIDSAMVVFHDKNGDSVSEILNQSQYYEMGDSLLQYQYQYGANALMMLAISSNETASGRSSLAFFRNNLFGHAAYDSNVEANASRYNSIASSVASHAKNYIANSYSNPEKYTYHGTFFGDKGSGMNVSYASDPYWGEKAAQYYMRIDTQMGNKDLNAYAIGIKSTTSDVKVYQDPDSSSNVLYTTDKNYDYSFVLLDKISRNGNSWYKVQIDPSMNKSGKMTGIYTYDFTEMIGYIKTSDVQYVLNSDKLGDMEYQRSYFSSGKGSFSDGSKEITITHATTASPSITAPVLEGHIFQEFKEVSSDHYEAVYKEVSYTWLEGDHRTTYTVGESLDLSDMTLRVLYTDGSKDSFPVTTSMVSAVSFQEAKSVDLVVSYQGVSAKTSVLVLPKDSTVASHAATRFNEFYALHKGSSELTEDEVSELVSILQECREYGVIFSEDEIRDIDLMLREPYQDLVQVVISENELDLRFSGLSFILPIETIEKHVFASTLYVEPKEVSSELEDKFKTIISGNGWHYMDSFEVEMLLEEEAIDLGKNYIISIRKPKEHDLSQHYILLAEKDGDIYRFYGKQTETRIYFQTQGYTRFAIAYQNTSNEYSGLDKDEVYRIDNNGFDVQERWLLVTSIGGSMFLILVICILMYLKPRKVVDHE